MDGPFQDFEPHGAPPRSRSSGNGGSPRLREIPIRMIIPNLITILAICAGLTGIRLAFEGRFGLAVLMVLAAAFLDGIDGRVARLLKATSRFGAEMDSLADIVNFGVAPALLLYAYMLDQIGTFGWVAAVIYAVACGLRLARFNVMAAHVAPDDWRSGYFTGIPAPAGAALVLLPVYLGESGLLANEATATIAALYTVLIAILMTSRLPVWSGKGGISVNRAYAVPVFTGVPTYVVLLASYPWQMLTVSTAAYFAFCVASWRGYRAKERQDAARQNASGQAGAQ